MDPSVRVIVADDHPLYREAVIRAIGDRPRLDVVGEAGDAETAMAKIRTLRPDVAVVDSKMPGDGTSVLDSIRAEELPTRVLMLSGYATSPDVYAAVSRGASGYLAKDVGGEAICDAIEGVARGETTLSAEAQSVLVASLRSRGGEAASPLSPREREILRLASDGSSNAEIARTLHLSAETVKSHLRNSYEKLGAKDRTAAVALAMRRGLID